MGDYLLQTDWQARNKAGGLAADQTARRALLAHVATYTLAFVPAFIWLAGDIGAEVVAIAAAIFLTHLVQDDRRLLALYVTRVKRHRGAADDMVFIATDQSLHILTLFAIALWAGI